MRTRLWLVFLGVGIALSAVYFLLPRGAPLNGLYDAMNLAAAAAVVVGVRIHRPARAAPWYLLAAGQALSACGNFAYDYYDIVRHVTPPYPGVSDALYLAAYPLLAAGMFLMVRSRNPGRDRANVIDATIIATGLGMLSWVFLIMPYANDPSLSLAEQLVSIAYPLMDVFLLFMLVRLVAAPAPRVTAQWFLALSFAFMLVADSIYAYMVLAGTYLDGDLVDLSWLLGFVFFGVAALHPSMRQLTEPAPDRTKRASSRRLMLLAGASLMAPLALLVQAARGDTEGVVVVAVGSATLFLLVLYRMSGLVRDVESKVDQLHRQGDQLEEAEARYRGVVEQIPAVTFIEVVDPSHPQRERALFVSPQVEAMTGCPPGAWLAGGPRSGLIHPDDRGRVLDARTMHRATGEPISDEYRLRTEDGRIVWVKEETKPVLDDSGTAPTRRWQGVLFDVTSHRVADEMKNTFLVAVSHELRTPLSTILGASLTLHRDDLQLSTPDARELIAALATNARKLNRLLADLLDLDRLDRGVLEPRRAPVDLRQVVERVLAETTQLADRQVELSGPDMVAELDPAMCERIVENLLVNSERHTPAGTRLWVKVEPEGDGVLLSVEDAGPGVPEEARGSIFEPFRQGPAIAQHAPGVGVGLSLVARFAELHGGRAWVDERPGGGASFKVWLFAPVHVSSGDGSLVAERVG